MSIRQPSSAAGHGIGRPVLNNLLEILHVARNMMTTDRLLNPIKEHLHKGINEYELLFSD